MQKILLINYFYASIKEDEDCMEWRFINSGLADCYTNMAVDEAIMQCYSYAGKKPTLRIYGWNPPAVSLGYFQNIERALNVEACKELKIDIVRRLTGGRAVLHQHEITYSIIIGEDYPGIPQSVVESYKFLCRGLIEGLKLAGANVSMESGRKNLRETSTQACFDSPSIYEIVCEGKKLVGSAQVRKNGVILQHGSILLDIDIDKNIAIMGRNKKEKQLLKQILENKTATLRQILGESRDFTDIPDLIFRGYCEALGIKGQLDNLLPDEELMCNELIKKFSSEAWILLK
ncbi:MAG: biotin/lipoate A/B protein ligase family protein [Deltaproteobacteria bacterium]